MSKDFSVDPEDFDRNIFRIMYRFKRALDDWGANKLLALNLSDFHSTYMPFFMRIGVSGISNNELAADMGITKQGASRIVKGLIASGMVKAEKSDSDARSSMLYFTEEGIAFYQTALGQLGELMNEYVNTVGLKDYNDFIDVWIKLTEFHERKPGNI